MANRNMSASYINKLVYENKFQHVSLNAGALKLQNLMCVHKTPLYQSGHVGG